ncbi:MAG: flagellar assembly peptidoglycan hydrolase FlgJ, partial [Steroidobacteraceae bacterium]
TGNLASLKRAAAGNSPQALREAARQFESLFTSMVLKSMQQANFKDPLFGSDQGDLYQEMYDDQLAATMSKGKGLGLADMLVQQLRREGAGEADSSGASAPTSSAAAGAEATSATRASGTGTSSATRSTSGPGTIGGAKATATASGKATAASAGTATAASATGSAATVDTAVASAPCPPNTQQAAFAGALWPDAQQAARQLGVNPVTLLAQAALETNWGRSVPQDASGGTSNNLFGIKAGTTWSGPEVSNSTREYGGGTATTVKAQFRSYDSASQCFQDYVDLLKSNPRYAAALGTGNDVQAFGSALQQGGYATDPAYASKLTAVAGTLTRAMTLKFAAGLPTTSGSGTLQRR